MRQLYLYLVLFSYPSMSYSVLLSATSRPAVHKVIAIVAFLLNSYVAYVCTSICMSQTVGCRSSSRNMDMGKSIIINMDKGKAVIEEPALALPSDGLDAQVPVPPLPLDGLGAQVLAPPLPSGGLGAHVPVPPLPSGGLGAHVPVP
jgi:hypothetical protein